MRITELPATPTAVVANLPYNVAVPVLLHLLATFPEWQRGLVMVQAEVADRISAPPGSKIYGVPSVKTAWYADGDAGGFGLADACSGRCPTWTPGSSPCAAGTRRRRPPPASRCSRSSTPRSASGARCCARRWPGFAGSSAAAVEALEAAGVDPQARGEVLDVTAFARIAERLRARGANVP